MEPALASTAAHFQFAQSARSATEKCLKKLNKKYKINTNSKQLAAAEDELVGHLHLRPRFAQFPHFDLLSMNLKLFLVFF